MEGKGYKEKDTYMYKNLEDAEGSIKKVGEEISTKGIPKEAAPLIVGLAGYGHVSQGAQEILDLLPVIEIKPEQIKEIYETKKDDTKHIYKVVFHEEDMVKPNLDDYKFELQDYYNHPEKYHSVMEDYLPYLTVLVNCIYWTDKYPRVITKEFAKKLYTENDSPVLKVIGDISCDLNGGVEFTVRETEPDNPCFIYNPLTDEAKLGFEGKGIAVMAIYNLPCELPKESSSAFSKVLEEFVVPIVEADYTGSFEDCHLPTPIKKAMIQCIAHNYMKVHVNGHFIGQVLSRYSMSILPIINRVKVFDITPYLKKGENILSVEAYNFDGYNI